MPQYTEEDLQNGIPANAQVVPVGDTSVAYNPNRKLTPDELVQKFYSVREKAPVIDQAKIDRLQRMGRINQLGQGVKVLADIAGTAMGANVRRRQPDSTAPALFQSYQAMLDKHKDQTDAYDLRDYQAKRDNLRFGIGQANHESQLALAAQKQKDWAKAKEADSKLDFAKWTAEYKRNIAKDKVDAEYKRKMGNKRTAGNIDKSNQPVTIRTKNNSYNLEKSQVDLYSSEMLSQPDDVKKKYPELYEEVPETRTGRDRYNNIVETPTGRNILKLKPNITRNDLARVYLENDEKDKVEADLNQRRANTYGLNPTPGVAPVKTQPTTTKKYSTGGYY